MVVGATLLSGFSALLFMKDSDAARQTFSTCWWMRLPVVITGTYESVLTHPEYKHPLSGMKLHLPNKRMDISYPIGQWGNMVFAAFGFLMAGSDAKKKQEVAKAEVATDMPTKTVNASHHDGQMTTRRAEKTANAVV